MIERLIAMYEAGALTGYQVMIDCLEALDPADPGPVLSELPEEILDEMLAYARRHDPRRPPAAVHAPPAADRVRAADRWILAHRARRSRPVNP